MTDGNIFLFSLGAVAGFMAAWEFLDREYTVGTFYVLIGFLIIYALWAVDG